ncbi:SRPBCC family protein [Methylocystis sp. SC2]|uniref:SRPBCC family protein n=1 Tax=Methylocystis sp. (strain SC2) TaxID=187303 RepID=UPI00027AECF0|nr:SRPBCC family protein [Methylocystis sp. SC2]CCJ08716.1 Polyketide cyclase/dehydrase [Methylocystis sp. SC2]
MRQASVTIAVTRRQLLGAVAALVFAPGAAFAAHGASPLKVVETTIVDAPPGKVWTVVSDFAHADWLPGVARVETSGADVPDEARRRLIMADGGVIEELLTKRDAERMLLGVHREGDDVKRLPATNYTALITLLPAEGGKTQVEWKARFYRGHPNNDPPPELNDDVAIAAVTAMQRAFLAALKVKVEGSVPSPRQ